MSWNSVKCNLRVKRLEEQIRLQDQRIRELMARSAQVEENMAATFHELRTPVTNIMGFTETLLAGVAAGNPAKTERFLGIIALQAARMAKLLNDMQTLMELESGGRSPGVVPIPLDEAVNRALEQIAGVMNNRNLALCNEGVPGIIVNADPDLLELALVNILTNAVTFTPDGGSVTVTGGLEGDHLTLTVADTGIGMAHEELSRIFRRFHRVDVARSRTQGGNGLGLALVWEIVARHGGDIALKSSVGEGTTVMIRLPACVPDESVASIAG
jgi:two-component system, OmpR family, phosphate regulon sensor histidine kinase PhoR